jgi:UDP-3-O-[3-hydroxymyristoyl] glucosamine N-acyltransferase
MKPIAMTAGLVAEWVGGSVEGDAALGLAGLASVESAGPTDLTFAADAKWASRLAGSRAGAAIVGKDVARPGMTLIRVGDVAGAIVRLLAKLAEPEDLPPPGIHPSAAISPQAVVAADAAIGPHAVVEAGAKIGAGCVLCAGVYVGPEVEVGERSVLAPGVVVRSRCTIGRNVRVGPNSVIGYDGFGYHFAGGVHHKVPHVGTVVIEDDVELGACTCVDRAKFGVTRIGAGTKIDNLVQIAHNVQLGKGCLLAALAGVAGSTQVGDFVVMGGHVGIRDNIKIGKGVQISAYAALAGDVGDGEIVGGIPARPWKEQARVMMAGLKLPDLLKRFRELEERVRALEGGKEGCRP